MKNFANWCRRYISVTGVLVIAAVIYMVFFQENSMARIYSYRQTIDSLNIQIKMQNDTMEYYRALNRELNANNPDAIERVVRENFNMCTADEDIYMIK